MNHLQLTDINAYLIKFCYCFAVPLIGFASVLPLPVTKGVMSGLVSIDEQGR